MKKRNLYVLFVIVGVALLICPFGQKALGVSDAFKNNIYYPGILPVHISFFWGPKA